MLAEGTEQLALLIEPYISETISSALGPILEFQRDVDDDDYVGDDLIDDDDSEYYGASPNSHKHVFPYMGFCASIWGNVRHHCQPHHHHHHTQKSKSINTEACLIAH